MNNVVLFIVLPLVVVGVVTVLAYVCCRLEQRLEIHEWKMEQIKKGEEIRR